MSPDPNGTNEVIYKNKDLSAYTLGIIPAGTTDFSFYLWDDGRNDTIQIFTRSGKHLAGTTVGSWNETGDAPIDITSVLTEENGFLSNASYDSSQLNGTGTNISVDYITQATSYFNLDGMNFSYTGDGGDRYWPQDNFRSEELTIDAVTEDLIIVITGYDTCQVTANWTTMPALGTQPGGDPTQPVDPALPDAEGGTLISIKTQELAQKGIVRLNEAIVRKDQIRAHLGAVQNRLENWKANGWRTSAKTEVKNMDLWEELLRLTEKHECVFHKVKGHADNPHNNRCDELAVSEWKKRIKTDESV